MGCQVKLMLIPPGRPHTVYTPETGEHVEGVIRENCRVTTNKVALELGINHGSADHIMHECVQDRCQNHSQQN